MGTAPLQKPACESACVCVLHHRLVPYLQYMLAKAAASSAIIPHAHKHHPCLPETTADEPVRARRSLRSGSPLRTPFTHLSSSPSYAFPKPLSHAQIPPLRAESDLRLGPAFAVFIILHSVALLHASKPTASYRISIHTTQVSMRAADEPAVSQPVDD